MPKRIIDAVPIVGIGSIFADITVNGANQVLAFLTGIGVCGYVFTKWFILLRSARAKIPPHPSASPFP